MASKKFLFFLLLPTFLLASPGYFEPWGKDADLIPQKGQLVTPSPRSNPFCQTIESIILFHQNHISPLHGARSNFRPTSSRYMLLSIRRYGFFKGFILGCDRLLRENKAPWVYRTRNIDNTLYKWDPTY